MAAPPSTAEVGGPPPAPLPPDNRCVYSLSPSEIAATNFLIQMTNRKQSQKLESSSPANGLIFPVINGNQPTVSKPSFADVAKHGDSLRKRKAEPILHIFGQPPPLPGAKLISENGVETLVFDDEATNILTTPLKWSLVGKFSHKLPSSQTVGKFLATLKLSGEYDLSWLSHRQLLIVLSEEVDYTRIWTKGLWIIDGCPMRTLKWTPTYNARIESPFAPVWVSLPGLPVHLFEKRALHMIASQLGKPLMVDAPTATRKRASLARICVEIDLLSPVIDILYLRINGMPFQQSITYEDMPTYCSHCNHIGHSIKQCFVKNVDLKAVFDEGRVEKKRKTKGKGPANEFVVHAVQPMHSTAMEDGESAELRDVESGSVLISVHSLVGQSSVAAATVDEREEGEIVGDASSHGDVAIPFIGLADHDLQLTNVLVPAGFVNSGINSLPANVDMGIEISHEFGPLAVVHFNESDSGTSSAAVINSHGSGPAVDVDDGCVLEGFLADMAGLCDEYVRSPSNLMLCAPPPSSLIHFYPVGDFNNGLNNGACDSNLYPKQFCARPLKTVYPDGNGLVKGYYSDGDVMRCYSDQDSPRSYDRESCDSHNSDDFDEFYGNAELIPGYSGRVTRSMSKKGITIF